MAFNDALFQLGMDLTRSSTAQEEDHSCAVSNAEVEDSVMSLIADKAHLVQRLGSLSISAARYLTL